MSHFIGSYTCTLMNTFLFLSFSSKITFWDFIKGTLECTWNKNRTIQLNLMTNILMAKCGDGNVGDRNLGDTDLYTDILMFRHQNLSPTSMYPILLRTFLERYQVYFLNKICDKYFGWISKMAHFCLFYVTLNLIWHPLYIP